jgi:Tat protein translocase TatB subunit
VIGSIGGFELLVLAAIGLLVFGPRRLPSLGRSLARGLGDLRRVANEMKTAVEKEADLSEVKDAAGELRKAINREAGRLVTDMELEAEERRPAEKGGEDRKREPRGQSGS